MKRVSHVHKHLKKVNEFQSHLASDIPSSFETSGPNKNPTFPHWKNLPRESKHWHIRASPYLEQTKSAQSKLCSLASSKCLEFPPSQADC